MTERTARAARALGLLACGLATASCGLRLVELDLHAPAECAAPQTDECPLDGIRTLTTRIVRADGTEVFEECVAPGPLCTFDDLLGLPFLRRSEASDGVEIRIEGRDAASCASADRGALRLSCESFGDSVIDLSRAESIPIWCDCPSTAP